MVDKAYMLEQPPAPAAWKRTLDLTVLPVLIDTAGAFEAGAERLAVQVRQRPIAGIGVALCIGWLAGWLRGAAAGRTPACVSASPPWTNR
jgi:hypothetical protein